jgi:hypothetical protein
MVFIGWLWRIVWRLILLFIIWSVFLTLKTRLEFILVSILGLIYVAIRGSWLGQVVIFERFMIALGQDFHYLRKLLNDPQVDALSSQLAEIEKKRGQGEAKVFFESIFLMTISLLCIYMLFAHLGDLK